MNTRDVKVLLCFSNPNFLKGQDYNHIEALQKDFKIQISNSDKMTYFLCKEWEPDICLIDGDSDMFGIIFELRKLYSFNQLGLVTVSKSNDIAHEEKAFLNGTDHYIKFHCKYTSIKLRIKNLIFRMADEQISKLNQNNVPKDQEIQTINFGNIKIYPNDYIVKIDNNIVNSTPTQFKLLLAFTYNRDHLLSRAWLKQNVWGESTISMRSIDAHISKLKKLIPELDNYLTNVYGKGYIFTFDKTKAA